MKKLFTLLFIVPSLLFFISSCSNEDLEVQNQEAIDSTDTEDLPAILNDNHMKALINDKENTFNYVFVNKTPFGSFDGNDDRDVAISFLIAKDDNLNEFCFFELCNLDIDFVQSEDPSAPLPDNNSYKNKLINFHYYKNGKYYYPEKLLTCEFIDVPPVFYPSENNSQFDIKIKGTLKSGADEITIDGNVKANLKKNLINSISKNFITLDINGSKKNFHDFMGSVFYDKQYSYNHRQLFKFIGTNNYSDNEYITISGNNNILYYKRPHNTGFYDSAEPAPIKITYTKNGTDKDFNGIVLLNDGEQIYIFIPKQDGIDSGIISLNMKTIVDTNENYFRVKVNGVYKNYTASASRTRYLRGFTRVVNFSADINDGTLPDKLYFGDFIPIEENNLFLLDCGFNIVKNNPVDSNDYQGVLTIKKSKVTYATPYFIKGTFEAEYSRHNGTIKIPITEGEFAIPVKQLD